MIPLIQDKSVEILLKNKQRRVKAGKISIMKLEKLNSGNSKFETFKKNEMLSMINIFGGQALRTSKTKGGAWTDCWEDSTSNDIHGTNPDGSPADYDVCAI